MRKTTKLVLILATGLIIAGLAYFSFSFSTKVSTEHPTVSSHATPIEEIPIKETFVATTSDTVLAKELYKAMPFMVNEVKKYINDHHLQITGHYLAQFHNLGKNRIRVNVGIIINRQADPGMDVKILHMPKGYVLRSQYEGEYQGVKKVYKALKQYGIDHAKSFPAPPWEVYLNDTLPVSDTSWCHVAVYCPIYR